ncbi:MAG: hypothetical protein IPK18_13000 [Sphingobacteriales bacterium]|jgi:hypothetical protein|nr:MAG: hypothetical protein IPK18_13000 [Sphingobacteriales bacterium]
MAEAKVTYLIGAGASANALPVVNGMNERMEIFVDFLKKSCDILKLNEDPQYRISNSSFSKIDNLLLEIKSQYTIDTYAKKLFLLEDYDTLEYLKRFLTAYLIFEQISFNTSLCDKIVSSIVEDYNKSSDTLKIEIIEKIKSRVDYRYDSIFANLLLFSTKKIDSKINFISWNYDNQFEISYQNYRKERYSLDEIQDELQIIPSLKNCNHNKEFSGILKLNGTAGFFDANMSYGKLFDFSKHIMDTDTIKLFIVSVLSGRSQFDNSIKFAWENDVQVTKAREYAKEIIGNSDIVVIIGYSFPTFNRIVDREIFKIFNEVCITRFDRGGVTFRPFGLPKDVKQMINKKIYIQDTPQNAPKIKERLKAIGNNLFDVTVIYDDVDQFLIPYEL